MSTHCMYVRTSHSYIVSFVCINVKALARQVILSLDMAEVNDYDSYKLLQDVADLSNKNLDSNGISQVESVLKLKSEGVTLDILVYI